MRLGLGLTALTADCVVRPTDKFQHQPSSSTLLSCQHFSTHPRCCWLLLTHFYSTITETTMFLVVILGQLSGVMSLSYYLPCLKGYSVRQSYTPQLRCFVSAELQQMLTITVPLLLLHIQTWRNVSLNT